MIDPKEIIVGVCSVLQEVRALLPKENVQDAADLLEHDEWGEALSLICTQLYEYDLPISAATYEKIELLGRQMGMASKEWTMLKTLVQPTD